MNEAETRLEMAAEVPATAELTPPRYPDMVPPEPLGKTEAEEALNVAEEVYGG